MGRKKDPVVGLIVGGIKLTSALIGVAGAVASNVTRNDGTKINASDAERWNRYNERQRLLRMRVDERQEKERQSNLIRAEKERIAAQKKKEKEEKQRQMLFEKAFLAQGEKEYNKRCKKRESIIETILKSTFN